MPCRRQTLAEAAIGSIEICSCGSIHVGVGPVVVRVEVAAFLAFAAVVAQARARLCGELAPMDFSLGRRGQMEDA